MSIKFINPDVQLIFDNKLNPVERMTIENEILQQRGDAYIYSANMAKIIKHKDPLEVLKLINEHFESMDHQFQHIVIFPTFDNNYSIGQLVKDTIDKAEQANGTRNSKKSGS